MIPRKTFYPWSRDHLGHSGKSNDSLYVFLNSICLRHLHNVCKKKLNIIVPSDFARLRVCDLELAGLTEVEINRLVCRLLDLGLPTGKLLPTTDGPDSMSMFDRLPVGNPPRFKPLRKLVGLKQKYHASAPVSPAHFDDARACRNRYGPQWTSVDHSTCVSTQPSRSFMATSPSRDVGPDMCASDTQHRVCGPDGSRPERAPLTCLISDQDIQLHSKIGIGTFGIVRRADWTTPSGEVIPVAVKLLRPETIVGNFYASFLDELRAMQCLSHPNLIRLHGVVLSNPIMMVTELAPLGSLLLHLRAQSVCASNVAASNSGTTSLCHVPRALQIDSLWDMGVQIACGMAYLSSRGLVHRDLAARNVLLASVRKGQFPQVKIGDFGLVRAVTSTGLSNKQVQAEGTGVNQSVQLDAIYTGRMEQRIPFAWSAPESLRDRLFSEASDVWSWGVTCWEIWTWGAAPWPGLDTVGLLSALDSGRRLAWPRLSCPRRLYQLMLACWRTEPGKRPLFSYLAERLDQIRPFEVVALQNLDEADRLGLEAGDVIVVSDGRPQNFWWRGQNRRTGEIGSFPRGIVQRDSKLSAEEISHPLANSLVHLGHMGRPSMDRLGQEADGCKTPTNKRPSLASNPYPSLDVTNSMYATASSVLYDDHEPGVAGSAPSAYVATLERLRREQAEGLWSPIPDVDSNAGFDFGWSKLSSEDSYSLCPSVDQFSLDTQNNLDIPVSTDRYDEQEDERLILDRTPRATIGSAIGTVKPQHSTGNIRSDPPLFYDTSDYQIPIVLPAPPGPEDEPAISTSHARSISMPSCHSGWVTTSGTNQPDPSDRNQSTLGTTPTESFECNMSATNRLVSPRRPESRRLAKAAYRRCGSQPGQVPLAEADLDKGQSIVQDPSAPPLIDLYSPTYKPNPLFSSMQFPTPSAPAYEPHLPYYFPPYRPTHWIQFGSEFRNMPAQPTERPHSVFIDPISVPNASAKPQMQATAAKETISSDPFDCSHLSDALPDPPSKDPFHWDVPRDRSTTPSAVTVSDQFTPSVTSLGPPGPHVESQLLVGSAAPPNPFFSTPVPNASETSASRSSQPVSPKSTLDIRDDIKMQNPVPSVTGETNPFHSCCSTSDQVPLSVEIFCVCAQLPGVMEDEARQALAYLLNPFVSVIPYLLVPPLPSAPLYQSATHSMTELSANRVQLAVRLISANRLHQLGMTSWEIGCQVLSAFNWCLPSAADWLLDRHSYGR